MTTMKRIVSILLLVCVLLTLCACGKAAEPETEPAVQPGLRYIVTALPGPEGAGELTVMTLDGETLYALDDNLSLFSMDINGGGWTTLDIDLTQGYPLSMTAGDGKLYILLSKEKYAFEDDTFILACDLSDKSVQHMDMEPLIEGKASTIAFVEGKLLVSSNVGCLSMYSADGEYITSYDPAGSNVSSVAIVGGKPYVIRDDYDGGELCALNLEDLDTTPMFTVGEPYCSFFSYQSAGELLCATGKGVSVLDPETGFAQPLFNWLDTGFSFVFDGPIGLTLTADGKIFMLDPSTGDIYRMEQSDAPDERKVLTVAIGAGVNGTYLSRAMAIFNMTNPDYVAKEFVYSSEDAAKVPAELSAAKDIDVVYMGTSTDVESAFRSIPLKSSLFEDLLPYLDADPELSREDFIPGVFDSMLQNGHLYGIVPGVMPYTIAAPKAVADGIEDWNMDAIFKLNNELPENYGLFNSFSREYMIEELMEYACARFVDMDNLTCSFDSEEFVRLLQLCAEAKPYDYDSSEGYALSMGNASMSFNYYREVLNGDFEYIGFPSEGGSNLLSQSIGPFSILASSENKDAAWQLIRLLFLPQIQNNEVNAFGMPVIVSSLDKSLARRAGNNAEISQADVDKYRALIMDCRGFIDGGAVYNIVYEEVNKFLGGGKTAEDAAASIQSRASIYISEQFG